MLNVRRLTTGAALLVTLGITATPISALSPTNLKSPSGGYITQNPHTNDSQVPNSGKQQYREDTMQQLANRSDDTPPSPKQLSTSGIEGRSMSSTIPGVIQRNPDGSEPPIKPWISPMSIPITVLDRAGRKVTRIQSNKEGYFRVSLKPGTYRLAPEIQQSNYLVLRNSDALKTVRVSQGQLTPVKIEYAVLAP